MEIVRYRLIGPQSHSVLAETLEAATVCDVSMTIKSTSEVELLFSHGTTDRISFLFFFFSKELQSSFWWPQHCKDQSNMNLHWQQTDVFNILKGLCLCVYFSSSSGF